MRDLWKIRESIAESMTRKGAVYKYDLSAPHHRMYEIVNDLKKRVHAIPEYQSIDIIGYGHLGDGMATELKHTELVSVTLTLETVLIGRQHSRQCLGTNVYRQVYECPGAVRL
jgi:hypothetical protein